MPLWNLSGMRREYRRMPSARVLILVASLLAVFCIVGVSVFQFVRLTPTHAAPSQVAVTFPTGHPAVLKQSRVNGPANAQQRLSLSIGLRVPNQDALTKYVQDISHPGSVNYHRYLTAAQYEAVFSPSKATYSALQQYLQTAGFTVTHTYSHRLLITFSGTVAQVDRTFGVTLKSYTAHNGQTYYGNDTDPQLPAWLISQVQSFTGLNNAVRFQHPPLRNHVAGKFTHASVQPTCLPQDTTGSYLLPSQMATAYNLNGLYNAGYQGEGQSIALFELATFNASDLTAYASCYGHSITPVQTVVTGSSAVPSDGGIIEVELDAQVILSAAPKLGRLVVYEAGNNEADYLAEWAQILQDAVPVVSTSWGVCENDLALSDAQLENEMFTAAAAQGQTVVSASGDSGSAGCAFDNTGNNSQPYTGLSAGDPGAQPFVTSVGGTSLTVNNATSAYTSEATWNNPVNGTYSGGASGGGISKYWAAPSWQSAPGVHNPYTSATPCGATAPSFCRETPDVSLQADPTRNSYLIYCTSIQAGCDPSAPWGSIGGTSAATPMWAALLAIANEMSVKQGGFNLGFVNPLLYQVGSNATNYAASFHDITTGDDDYNNDNPGLYPATPNYDMATGLGSYNALALATNLVTLAQNASPTRISPASTIWYFAEGSVGNGFQEFITLQNPSVTQDATVNITYLFENKASVIVSHPVPKSSRATESVNDDLKVETTNPQQQAIAAIVQVINGGPAIVAERPMYFSHNGVRSGTDVVGATNPQNTYYFPSVDTRHGARNYLTYLTMLNPSTSQTANVTVTYYTGNCGQGNQTVCPTQTVPIAPLHRGTATPLALSTPLYQQTSVTVQSDSPVVVERPTYLSDNIPTAGGAIMGAMSEVGATNPGKDWLFAEGYTASNFQEYLTLANFGTTDTSAVVTLEYDNGHRQAITVTVPALNHVYFDVNQANATPTGTCDVTPCQTSPASSAEVTSTANIVVDRLMYFHYSSAKISGATEAVGEPGPASHSVYAFAEGFTAGSFQEYLTLQNPTATDETVAITMFADTYVLQEQVIVKAKSRQTVSINKYIVPIAQTYNNMNGPNSYAVSMTVQALGTGAKIVAERPMYFNFHGDPGGTDVLGYAQLT